MAKKNSKNLPVAIAIDTSTFEQHQFAFRSSLLARLAQFKGSEVKVLMPEVVKHEVISHLEKSLETTVSALKNAIRDTANPWGTTKAQRDSALEILNGGDEPKARAAREFQEFMTATDAIVLNVGSSGDIRRVFDLYFSNDPPFSSGKKKSEFPDAFALTDIERWSRKNGRVIVVSNDDDWEAYCASTSALHFTRSLSEALSEFQSESASHLEREFIAGVAKKEWGIAEKIAGSLADQSDLIEFHASIDSQFYADDEGSLAVLSLVDDAFSDIRVEAVEVSPKKIVFSMVMPVLANIETEASFQKWDSIDREYLSMGSATLEAEEEIQAMFVITCSIRGNGSIGSVCSVDLEPDQHTICYYDAEPSWMSDPSNYGDDEE